MLVRGLDDKEIDNYFSDMMTEKEMRPYIEGARRQGYRQLYGCQQKPGNRSYIEGVRRQGYRQDFEEGSERGGHRLDL